MGGEEWNETLPSGHGITAIDTTIQTLQLPEQELIIQTGHKSRGGKKKKK